jgi:hypothetical protein
MIHENIDANDVILNVYPRDKGYIVAVKKYTDWPPYSIVKSKIFDCAPNYLNKRAREKARELLRDINQEIKEKSCTT